MGDVTDEWYAAAAGAINYGFPTIADTPIPQILPTGVCTYEHVISNVPHNEMVNKAVEVRGLKVTVTEVPVPVAYGPAFEGERIRGEDIFMEAGGGKTQAVELTVMKEMDEVEDGKELLCCLGLRSRSEPELIACPTCGRIEVDLSLEDGEQRIIVSSSVRKWPFSAISASSRAFACAAYLGTPPRNSLSALTLRKMTDFEIRKPSVPVSNFETGTNLENRGSWRIMDL